MPAASLIALSFLHCRHWMAAVGVLAAGVAFCGFEFNGYLVNPLDIAPRYAGIMIGLARTIGATAGFASPFLVTLITSEVSGLKAFNRTQAPALQNVLRIRSSVQHRNTR